MALAFTQIIQQSRGEHIYLVLGGVDKYERAVWHFIRVAPAKARAFERAINSGTIELKDYGTVLESGIGAEPPYTTVEQMRNDYGYTG